MPKLPALLQRPFALLGIALVLWLLLPVLFQRWARASFFEMLAPAASAPAYVRDVQEFWSLRTRDSAELVAAGRDLARLAAAFELRTAEAEVLRAELRRLEELLQLPAPPGYRFEVARVERRDVTAWWQQLVVRKGRNYGVPVGAAVVFAGGVVGRVREVSAFSSVVELIGSPGLRLVASVEGDARPVAFTGALGPPFGPAFGRAEFLPADLAPGEGTPPRRLVTSGLGEAFPAGLLLGTLGPFRPEPDGLLATAEVRLDPRLGSVREVAILLPTGEVGAGR